MNRLFLHPNRINRFSELKTHCLLTAAALLVGCAPESENSQIHYLDRDAYQDHQPAGFATSGQNPDEICVIPKTFPGASYSAKDIKRAGQLCSYDFHQETGDNAVGVCPKLVSTNPGLEIHALGTLSKPVFESTECKKPRDRNGKKLAKFKQTITCSYTGSILAYYHMSRLLGDIVKVPQSVIRTLDLSKMKTYVERGQSFSTGYIAESWDGLNNALFGSGGTARTYQPLLLTTDKKQVFGALSVNPRGERRHPLINVKPYSRFAGTTWVSRVLNANQIGTMVGREFEKAQYGIRVMKDISDMILLDFILAQQDRLGNIHSKDYYYYLQDGKTERVAAKKIANPAAELPSPNVKVPIMVLKDSDCGVRQGSNLFKKQKTLEKVRHMDPDTYAHLRWLVQEWKSGAAKEFLIREAALETPNLWGNSVHTVIEKNLFEAEKILVDNCKAGKLLLDLDPKAHMAMKNSPDKVVSLCDRIHQP